MVQLPHKVKGNMGKSQLQSRLDQPCDQAGRTCSDRVFNVDKPVP